MADNVQPILFVAEDDTQALSKIEQDLLQRYSDRYQVLTGQSEQETIAQLKRLKQQGDQVALLLIGCNVAGTPGEQLMEQASGLFPNARRVLLASYGEKVNVTRAVEQNELDSYLLTPLGAPEDDLYPMMDDLLADWKAIDAPHQPAVRIVGYRWSAQSHQLKSFLARNLVPYHWEEIERSPEARQVIEDRGIDYRHLPVIFLPDGSYLSQPSLEDLAEKVGLHQQAGSRFYDLVVVGGGPSGLSAAVYGASEGLETLLIEAEAPGGQAGQSSKIENYLGFPSGLSGNELTRRAVAQAERFGVEILTPQSATGLQLRGRYRLIQLADGSQVACHAALISTGVSYLRLKVPGEDRLTGAGVYYGTVITEAISCQDREVFILGGGNSAGQAAMYLSRFASKVTILTNTESLGASMSFYLVHQIEAAGNIHSRFNCTVVELHGDDHLEAITIEDLKTGKQETIGTPALFVYIGAHPRTDWLEGVVARDEMGYILTGMDVVNTGSNQLYQQQNRTPFFLESSVPGVFAAGDTRYGSVKRIASAVGEGAMAVTLIHQYLSL